MKITDELLMDTRLIKRNIENGLVTKEDYEKHLADLNDLQDVAEVVDVEMSDVGVAHAEAKDTGEND